MDPIILSAIKKAKKELEEKHQVSAQTLDDLKSALADLKDTKLPRWVQDILDKVDQSTTSTGTTLSQLKASLEEKLSPWTGTRAAKLDNLDTKVSSRADGSYYTPARASKLDKLDTTVSSRLSKTDFDTGNAAVLDKVPSVKDWTPVRATKVDSLDATVSSRADGSYYTPARAVKLDSLDANITTRATQASVQDLRREVDSLKNRGTIKRVQRGWIQPGTGGWEKIRASTKYGGNFYEKEITLPYAVDVSKSKESATAFEYVSYSSNSGVGVTCFLSGSQKLILRIDEKSVSFDGNSNGICWTVEEWY